MFGRTVIGTMTKPKQSNAELEGREARKQGLSDLVCPYPHSVDETLSQNRLDWMRGYLRERFKRWE